MREVKLNTVVLLVLLTAMSTGCKKDDPSPSQESGRLLAGNKGSSKTWKLVLASEQVEDGSIDLTTLDPCILDNLYTFTNNDEQSYTATEGAIKCLDSDPDFIESGYWTFTDNGKVVIVLSNHIVSTSPGAMFSFYGYGLPSEVIELKEGTFKIKMTYIKQQGVATLTRHYYFNFVKV